MDYRAIKQFMRHGWVSAAFDRPARDSMVFQGGKQRMTISEEARGQWGPFSRISGVPSDAVQSTDDGFTATWESYADTFFQAGGALSKMIQGYEPRIPQMHMSRVVERTIAMADVAVISAPTGTGKSLAYLVPAMRAKAKGKLDGSVIISTSNKALQRQIMESDAPMMADIFPHLQVASLKGKTNYVCEVRLRNATLNKHTRHMLETLETGEIDEIQLTPEERADVQVTQDTTCAGCPLRSECRFQEQRAAAKRADVVIINHASLAMSMVHPMAANYPSPAVIIVDEAHKLEGFIRGAMGNRITWRAMEMLRKLITKLGYHSPDFEFTWNELIGLSREESGAIVEHETSERGMMLADELEALSAAIEPEAFPPANDEEREAYAASKRIKNFAESLRSLSREGIAGECRWAEDDENDTTVAIEMTAVDIAPFCREMLGYTDDRKHCSICHTGLDEYEYLLRKRPVCIECVAQVDEKDEDDIIALEDTDAEPVDRLPLAPAWVFTSATLETATPHPVTGQSRKPTLDTFCQRLGIPTINGKYTALTASTPSPFNHEGNVMLYVPPGMPRPEYGNNNHSYGVDGQMGAIGHMKLAVQASEGGALILFSSNFAMKQCYEALRKPFKEMGLTVMCQGDMPKGTIIDHMRKNIGCVVFATKSFFEGVDVPTLSLRLVIIHKIPFEPSTPLNVARERVSTEEGKDLGLTGDNLKYHSFNQIRVVDATLETQQAFGRLVRRATDKGVVMITDPRMMSTGYGRNQIGASLPVRATGETEYVMAFLKKLAIEAREEEGNVSGKQFALGLDF